MRTRPWWAASATIFSPSSTVEARGFSMRTCLPASRAAEAMAQWVAAGVATATASTVGSFRTSSKEVVTRTVL